MRISDFMNQAKFALGLFVFYSAFAYAEPLIGLVRQDNSVDFSFVTESPCFEIPLKVIESHGQSPGRINFKTSVKNTDGGFEEFKNPLEFHVNNKSRCAKDDPSTWRNNSFSTILNANGEEEVILAGMLSEPGNFEFLISLGYGCKDEYIVKNYIFNIAYVSPEVDEVQKEDSVNPPSDQTAHTTTQAFSYQFTIQPNINFYPSTISSPSNGETISSQDSAATSKESLNPQTMVIDIPELKELSKQFAQQNLLYSEYLEILTKPSKETKSFIGNRDEITFSISHLDTSIGGNFSKTIPLRLMDTKNQKISSSKNLKAEIMPTGFEYVQGRNFFTFINWLPTKFAQAISILNQRQGIDSNTIPKDKVDDLLNESSSISLIAKQFSGSEIIQTQIPLLKHIQRFLRFFGIANAQTNEKSGKPECSSAIQTPVNSAGLFIEVQANFTFVEGCQLKAGVYKTYLTIIDGKDPNIEHLNLPIIFEVKHHWLLPLLITLFCTIGISVYKLWVHKIPLGEDLNLKFERLELVTS